MPAELYYTTGQVAKELGTSPAALRSLCASGAIGHKTTAGGQYRIPGAVLAQLKRDGLPPVARPLPDEGGSRPARKNGGREGLLADPSDEVARSAEAAKMSGHDVEIARNRVDLLRAKKDAVEIDDFFDARERARREEQAAEQQRRQQAQAEQRRQVWADEWIEHALGLIPTDAPRDIRLDVTEAVRAALESWDPSQPDTLTGRLVEAAVERGLRPWHRGKEIEAAIAEAADSLPHQAKGFSWSPSEWDIRAKQAAADAIGNLREGATPEEIRVAARQAVDQIGKEFEHQKACREMVAGCTLRLRGENSEEDELAKDSVRAALGTLPIGTSQRERERARDAVLAPIQVAIDVRRAQEQTGRERQRDQEMREDVIRRATWKFPLGFPDGSKERATAAIRAAVAGLPHGTPSHTMEEASDKALAPFLKEHERAEKKRELIDAGLREIHPYLLKLEEEWEFDKGAWTLADDLKPAIREQLESELRGNEPEEQVRNRVRRLVREELRL